MTEQRPLVHEAITRSLIGGFFECYNHLGFGFVEPICASALEHEFIARGHKVVRELAIEVSYKGEIIGWQRMDMVVDDVVIIEVKATPSLSPNARLQLRSYMKATQLQVGLLFHFGPRPMFFREFLRQQVQGFKSAQLARSAQSETISVGADTGPLNWVTRPIRDESC